MNLLTPDEISKLPGITKNFNSLADVPAGFSGKGTIDGIDFFGGGNRLSFNSIYSTKNLDIVEEPLIVSTTNTARSTDTLALNRTIGGLL
jgi:hypothetical protein